MKDEDNELLHNIRRDLESLTQRVESAFPRDEDGEPAYGAHRLFHKKQEAEEEAYAASKAKIFSAIISWVAIGALTIIGSALVNTYVLTHPLPGVK